MSLNFQDIMAVVGIVVGPFAMVLIWAIRLEGKVKQLADGRLADLKLLAEQRLSDGNVWGERQRRVDEKLNGITTQLGQLPALQRSVDLVVAAIGQHTGPHRRFDMTVDGPEG